MELKKLTVHNYKSLVNFELNEPNAFTVFAGPNGAGKSNIFEALEFGEFHYKFNPFQIGNIFGNNHKPTHISYPDARTEIFFELRDMPSSIKYLNDGEQGVIELSGGSIFLEGFFLNGSRSIQEDVKTKQQYHVQKKFFQNFLRLFINKSEFNRIKYTSNERLLPDASNLESVLKRILKDEAIKEEFLEWLDLFIPGFSNIEIHSDNIGGTDTLFIYEEGTTKPFTKNLISDGTYNILALLTAVYQTAEPQFLCIEEPENGLNPYVVESLVDFFRRQCQEKGHVIWLNTHSQTLVKYLRPEELVLVEKKKGETLIKQFPADYNLQGFKMDEAWLSNMLGGGLPW